MNRTHGKPMGKGQPRQMIYLHGRFSISMLIYWRVHGIVPLAGWCRKGSHPMNKREVNDDKRMPNGPHFVWKGHHWCFGCLNLINELRFDNISHGGAVEPLKHGFRKTRTAITNTRDSPWFTHKHCGSTGKDQNMVWTTHFKLESFKVPKLWHPRPVMALDTYLPRWWNDTLSFTAAGHGNGCRELLRFNVKDTFVVDKVCLKIDQFQ